MSTSPAPQSVTITVSVATMNDTAATCTLSSDNPQAISVVNDFPCLPKVRLINLLPHGTPVQMNFNLASPNFPGYANIVIGAITPKPTLVATGTTLTDLGNGSSHAFNLQFSAVNTATKATVAPTWDPGVDNEY